MSSGQLPAKKRKVDEDKILDDSDNFFISEEDNSLSAASFASPESPWSDSNNNKDLFLTSDDEEEEENNDKDHHNNNKHSTFHIPCMDSQEPGGTTFSPGLGTQPPPKTQSSTPKPPRMKKHKVSLLPTDWLAWKHTPNQPTSPHSSSSS
jgi:hypothetical protein